MTRVLTQTTSIGFTQRSRRWRASGQGHPLPENTFHLSCGRCVEARTRKVLARPEGA
jgi:hypothetical protein